MFNFFGKKNQKEEFKYREKNMSNRMNDLGLKIDQVEKQLKAQLQV